MSDDKDEIAMIQDTTVFIDSTVEFVEQDLPMTKRRCIPNALLNVAIARMIAREGRERTANILDGLSYALASGADPGVVGPIPIASVTDVIRMRKE